MRSSSSSSSFSSFLEAFEDGGGDRLAAKEEEEERRRPAKRKSKDILFFCYDASDADISWNCFLLWWRRHFFYILNFKNKIFPVLPP